MAWIYTRRSAKGKLRSIGMYRDPSGAKRSAGTYPTKTEARDAANIAEAAVNQNTWFDTTPGNITFATYAEAAWWPSLHVELTTRAAYRSNLDTHFLPAFANMPMAKILPSHIQTWVNQTLEDGLSNRSEVKYHVVLHGIFKQAVRDRIIQHNPCNDTRLPKVVKPTRRILTSEEFSALLDQIPDRWLPSPHRHRNGPPLGRTGRLTAPACGLAPPRSPRGTNRVGSVEEGLPHRGTDRVQGLPKDDEPRTLTVTKDLTNVLSYRIAEYGLGADHLLFPSTEEPSLIPVARNTFRTKSWQPAIQAADLGFPVRMHDPLHAHASWLLAGGADLAAVMQRLGHRQIMTT